MIRTSPATYYRAATAIAAAAALSVTTARHAAAQQTVDLFGGTLGTPTALSLGGTGVNTTTSTPVTTFGPGYTGVVSLGATALNTLSEGFATGGTSNTFTITETGVASAAGSTSASKTFTGTALTPGATYALTLTRTTGFTVGLLGSINLTLSAGGVPFVNTASGQGLLNTVDVLGLFGSNGVASFQFTVPAGTAGNLGLNITSSEPVGALGGSYVFQSGAITQVPEPGPIAAMLLGVGGLAALRFRRRLRAL